MPVPDHQCPYHDVAAISAPYSWKLRPVPKLAGTCAGRLAIRTDPRDRFHFERKGV
jgi:hypothetical protein